MAPFITARCYEQVKCVIASMNLPVTLIAVGVGLGYDHATLTHFTPEDIACMRALNRIEVLSPADAVSAAALAVEAIKHPKFRYIRLERQAQNAIYDEGFAALQAQGFAHLVKGNDVVLCACGYLVHKALNAREALAQQGISAGVIDLFRLKRVDESAMVNVFAEYGAILTVEEQLLEGGFGSIVAETLIDQGV